MALHVLVVDDEKINRHTTTQQLRDHGYKAEACENAFQALQRLEEEPWDIVISDLRMPNMNGIEFFRKIRKCSPEIDVILMTAYGTVESAVAALREGAADYLTKPFKFSELHLRLKRIEQLRATRNELRSLKAGLGIPSPCFGLVGRSTAMRTVFEQIQTFAEHAAPVLITGETGTGKEVVARALHREGPRRDGPFVAVPCGAVPAEVAESELFGHEKGAFTGAMERRRGCFERAHAGSLLLDDVDDLPLNIQTKLLRVLETGTLLRVGGEVETSVDVRVISTTKTDLALAADERHFRYDLLYRLRVLSINLPPLRERREDVLLLARHFLELLATRDNTEPKALGSEAAALFGSCDWPGNVRQLRHAIESAVAVCPGQEILPKHVPEFLRHHNAPQDPFALNLEDCDKVNLKELVDHFEDEVIHWALMRAGGEQQKAADILGVPRSTLQSKIARRRQQ